jgi:hypothetical protein
MDSVTLLGDAMSSDAASSRGIPMQSPLRKPAARPYEKPTLVKTDSIIAITAVTAVSTPI